MEFMRKICTTRVNFNIELQLATCSLQLAVYRDMQYVGILEEGGVIYNEDMIIVA